MAMTGMLGADHDLQHGFQDPGPLPSINTVFMSEANKTCYWQATQMSTWRESRETWIWEKDCRLPTVNQWKYWTWTKEEWVKSITISRIFYKNSAYIDGTVSLKEQIHIKGRDRWTLIIVTDLPVDRVKWPLTSNFWWEPDWTELNFVRCPCCRLKKWIIKLSSDIRITEKPWNLKRWKKFLSSWQAFEVKKYKLCNDTVYIGWINCSQCNRRSCVTISS